MFAAGDEDLVRHIQTLSASQENSLEQATTLTRLETRVDRERIARAVKEILMAIGDDPAREGLLYTPDRVGEMFGELFRGLSQDPVAELSVGFEEGYNGLIVLGDIPFYSLCEHHLLPFYGVAHVGYVAAGRVVGLSKLARIVDILARRPQLQERLTNQVADVLCEGLTCAGAAVVTEATHMCIAMRGVHKPDAVMTTSTYRGVLKDDDSQREEFWRLVRQSGQPTIR